MCHQFLHSPCLSPTRWGRCRDTVLPASYEAGVEILMPLPGVPRAMTATVQTLRFKLLPHEPGQEWGHSCQQEIERRYQVVPSVVCAMCCLFGIIYCFFGYRCFKAVMFLTGLMFGSIIIFMLCYKERVLDTQLSVEASVGIGLGIGVLCGLVTMLVRSVGLFMVGLLLGLLLAVATLVVMEQFYHPPTVWIPIALLLGVGMLFAVLTLQWQRFFTTLSTAVFGSAIMTVTVDYFIELFLLVQYIYERIKVAPARPVCCDHQPAAAPRATDAHQAAGRPKGEEEEAETPPPTTPPAQSPPPRACLPPQAQPCAPLRWGRALPQLHPEFPRAADGTIAEQPHRQLSCRGGPGL
ncbi:transmembrane protein 198 isoform X3 [Aphelocoma coerulescens]|uniref:transmembrane protein 198 isoform X3 n=1 Tax=Aphelocoma coerulescens TaxID=39617 RepID=UPI003604FD67